MVVSARMQTEESRSAGIPTLLQTRSRVFVFKMYALECLDFTNATKGASAEMMTATKTHTRSDAPRGLNNIRGLTCVFPNALC